MIKYSTKMYKIMYEAGDSGEGGEAAEEKLGYNKQKIETLKTDVNSCFETLKGKTNFLDDLETIVQGCWNGPDAEEYLDSVYAKANELIKCCGEAYNKINATIDAASDAWSDFQSANSILV